MPDGRASGSRGRVLIDDTRYRHGRRTGARPRGSPTLPQGREIFSELTVGENIEAAARAHGTLGTPVLEETIALFPVLKQMWRRAGGACPAVSSSSLRSRGRSSRSRAF